jgi:hypothetical protein
MTRKHCQEAAQILIVEDDETIYRMLGDVLGSRFD